MSKEEITYEQVMEYCKKRCLDLIDHAFLVRLYNNREAIPVEWLKEQIHKATDPYNDDFDILYAGNLSYTLELWEKEK